MVNDNWPRDHVITINLLKNVDIGDLTVNKMIIFGCDIKSVKFTLWWELWLASQTFQGAFVWFPIGIPKLTWSFALK